jgi:hypothetical protein
MSEQRPTSILVIGWLAIVWGGLAVLGNIQGLGLAALMHLERPDMARKVYARWFVALLVTQLIASVLAAWAGWAFTQCRNWGRTTLELLVWLGLVSIVGFGIYWCGTVLSMGLKPPDQHDYKMVAFGALVCLFFASIPGVVLSRLRSDDVRRAMQGDYVVPDDRSVPAIVIGWFGIVTGGFLLLMFLLIGGMAAVENLFGDSEAFSSFSWISVLLLVAQMAFAALLVWSGRALSRHRARGRVAFEILAWLGLFLVAGFGLFWMSQTTSTMSTKAPTGFGYAMLASGLFNTLAFASLPSVALYFLRSDELRDAMR